MGHYEEQYAEFGALGDDLNKAVENKDPKKFAEVEKKIAELPNTGYVDVPDNPRYDRFNLEDRIQNVWNTSEDLDSILFRVSDDPDGSPTEDQLANLLIGLKEMHDSRCRELMYVFETMIHDDCFKVYREDKWLERKQ
jgi:hypothetical protein